MNAHKQFATRALGVSPEAYDKLQETFKPRGRPPLPEGQAKRRLEISVPPIEREQWEAKAEAAGLSLSAWIQCTCNAAKA
jgi:hypothetical protein